MIGVLSVLVFIVEVMVVVLILMMIEVWIFVRIIGVVSGSFILYRCCQLVIFIFLVMFDISGGIEFSLVSVFCSIGSMLYNVRVISVGSQLKFSIGIVIVSIVIGGKVCLIVVMVFISG